MRRKALVCVRCPLALTRMHVVFGEGRAGAGMMVVGEAPGQTEDREGRPFVGPAGQQLRALLAAAGLSLVDVYLTNVVLCHPPGKSGKGDRTPAVDEVEACRSWLDAQMVLVGPRVILAVGVTAAHRLLGSKASLGALRGRVHGTEHGSVIVTYHPSGFNRAPGRRDAFLLDAALALAALQEGS